LPAEQQEHGDFATLRRDFVNIPSRKTMLLALVVFVNGMAVMILEMVGARLIAPWLGTSITVWTSLIGVILASLSLGCWLGGRLADKHLSAAASARAVNRKGKGPRVSDADGAGSVHDRAAAVLAGLLTAAAVTVLITAGVQRFLLESLSGSVPSLHLAAVLAALSLFFLPGLFCGMVSPYAIRLAITDSETAGSVVGRLNALATVGSIAGAFLGGFVLISWFGSVETTLGVSALLLAAAACVRLRPVLVRITVGLCLLLVMFVNWSYSSYQAASGVITEETRYACVRVANGLLEGRAVRLLFTDPGSCQSASFMDDPAALAFAYTRFYALGAFMNPQARRILMLGGGGYSVPKWLLAGRSELTARDFRLDVVELDPGITALAQRHFNAPAADPRMRVFHEDARTFINRAAGEEAFRASGPYDLIFADIFNSYYTVPFHVGTVEAARKIRDLLAPDGIYIMNVISAITGDKGRLLRSIRNAFAEVFGEVHIFPVQSTYSGAMVQNVMLMAFRTPRPLPDPAKAPAHVASMLSRRWTSSLPDPEKDVPPLRDDYAPVERYTLGFHEK
jgi:spermidine synthase